MMREAAKEASLHNSGHNWTFFHGLDDFNFLASGELLSFHYHGHSITFKKLQFMSTHWHKEVLAVLSESAECIQRLSRVKGHTV